MPRLARLLPFLTVGAWAVTLVIPILDSGNAYGPSIVVSSLGGAPLELTEAKTTFLFAWAGVVGSAISVWVWRSSRWRSLVTMLVAVALAALLLDMLLDPPSLIWDGVDGQGNHTGGYEVGEPAAGALLWAVGIAALFAAGICGLLEQTPAKRVTSHHAMPNR